MVGILDYGVGGGEGLVFMGFGPSAVGPHRLLSTLSFDSAVHAFISSNKPRVSIQLAPRPS